MARRIENTLYGRDLVIIHGQSNCGASGSSIAEWPAQQRADPNTGFASNFMSSSVWGTLETSQDPTQSGIYTVTGTIVHSLGVKLRGIGMRPSIMLHSVGGASSKYLYDNRATTAGYFADWVAQQINPRSVTLVYMQGEAESLAFIEDDIDYTHWASNVAGTLDAIRAAIGYPDAKAVIWKLPSTWLYESSGLPSSLGFDYLDETQAAQESLVASDPTKYVLWHEPSVYVRDDGIHIAKRSHEVLSNSLAPIIKGATGL